MQEGLENEHEYGTARRASRFTHQMQITMIGWVEDVDLITMILMTMQVMM